MRTHGHHSYMKHITVTHFSIDDHMAVGSNVPVPLAVHFFKKLEEKNI